jgi:hypothetical protein
MRTDRASVILLAAALATASFAAPAHAQTQWDQYGNTTWGQYGAPPWGQYQKTVGANGWQLNQTLTPNAPAGAVASPNQLGAGAKVPSLFTRPDTRLLGRNAP